MGIPKSITLLVCVIFVFTGFILTIVATAGSTSNYSPINNVYLGEADISRINVTKVIPETAPILDVLAAAMQTSNGSNDYLFSALRTIAGTAALGPLLSLLGNSNNLTTTVESLAAIAPLIVQSNASSSSSQALGQVNSLMANSNNVSATLGGLQTILAGSSSSVQDANSTQAVFEILSDSHNATASANALAGMNNLSASDKQQLAPVFVIFQESSNATATLQSLGTLITANISAETGAQLISALQTGGSDLQATISRLSSSVPSSMNTSIMALGSLLTSSRNANTTLQMLGSLLQQNVSSSAPALAAFQDLSVLLRESDNATATLTSVAVLSNSTSQDTAQQLSALQEILNSSKNSTETVEILQSEAQVQAQGNSNSSSEANEMAVGNLTNLLHYSTNETETFISLMQLSQYVQANSTAFTPLLGVLSQVNAPIMPVNRDVLENIMPEILNNLRVDSRYRLSIFTLCRGLSTGKIQSCSSPHAVQSFVMRDILYDELETSDFKPYMDALNVQKQDLYLEGKLQKKEHSYVPAVRSALAFNLLVIILSFFCLITLIVSFVTTASKPKTQKLSLLASKILLSLVAIFALLSGAIITAMINIIKSDTKTDDYNVRFYSGSAYLGLIWTTFTLSFIALVILLLIRPSGLKGDAAGAGVLSDDLNPNTSSEADSNEKLTRSDVANA
ncbi:LAMI_0A01640g1_1 [Lachancea mirantina]|uniref:LAMI_0A01640g1_1 n=1 Tax=Lachancea mirantina TaxID=1230905 RepID=A0A1G4ILT9_9SACH|nr:LAMI_0A01640g1_1 [Lachancea mirantina]